MGTNGNIALFCDLVGTLVAMDKTRQLPLDTLGGILTAWQICPHDNDDGCECRKPRAGMITDLAAIHGVDLKASAMVGDQASDAEAARNAGLERFVYARDFFGWQQS